MATQDMLPPDATKVVRLSVESQESIHSLLEAYLTTHNKFQDLNTKMDAIDVAYARYKAPRTDPNVSTGIDSYKRPGTEGCGNVFDADDVTPPIVVSQVDTYVAYLAEVFLTGNPLFPVVSSPSKRVWAEQLETLLDDHAMIGGYARELLLFIKDGVKYNYSAIEVEWTTVDQFTIAGDFSTGTGKKLDRSKKGYTAVRRLNPRNVFHDMTVPVAEISKRGDYAGYIEYVSRIKVKQELNKLTADGNVYNAGKAFNTEHPNPVAGSSYYRDDPVISKYINSVNMQKDMGVDWEAWFTMNPSRTKVDGGGRSYGAQYERIVTYARIIPSDLRIGTPQPNTPQIWKFIHINGTLICAKRIISAYDYLPILFGQPLEDGLGYQTQSVAEGVETFQDAAAKLFNIRFAGARRAVSDRALYDPEVLKSTDVNSIAAAPKIPIRLSSLSKKTLGDYYHPIPFDSRGLETVIQDAQTIVSFSKELTGANAPQQGQFQRGNKSVKEWNDTMSGSDGRLRLPALMLEIQVFGPFKSMLTLNVFQYGEDSAVVSQKTGETLNIDLTKLREQVLAFRVADGYTPKSKLAAVEVITAGMNMIATSPILQQAYGSNIPGMFAHLMQLGGVRGLEEYDPNYKAPSDMPSENLDANTLQAQMQASAPDAQAAQMPIEQTPPASLA